MRHPKRWWGIRHVRCKILEWQVYRWARRWAQVGIGLGWPNEADLEHLQRIWDGDV